MKIVLLGAGGQLGRELHLALDKIYDVTAFTRKSLDITSEKELSQKFELINPDVVLNCASYNFVDQAEKNKAIAVAVNGAALKSISKLCNIYSSFLVHFSTDYVFGGSQEIPYKEDDRPEPQNIYGASKLLGEKEIANNSSEYVIFRTSWVYSKSGQNFLSKVLSNLLENASVKVVSDQVGAPTSVGLIVRVIVDLLADVDNGLAWESGVYHLVPNGYTNRYEMAERILQIGKANSTDTAIIFGELIKATSNIFSNSAKRPLSSKLDNSKLAEKLTFKIPHWTDDFDEITSYLINQVNLDEKT